MDHSLHEQVIAQIETAIVGKRGVIELVLDAIAAGGHVLLDDVPGVAKTMLAKSMATATGLSFSRIQFTPDLMPADVTGSSIWNQATGDIEFRPGPIFAQVVLADEINRAPAKTQAALLEAMAEGQVTVDGATHLLPQPFVVIATQNPVEYEGTYALPEAQLDRFLISTAIGYPSGDDEAEVVRRRLQRGLSDPAVQRVGDGGVIGQLREISGSVMVHAAVIDYAVRLTSATRELSGVDLGASPRGSIGLIVLAQARAARLGRDHVVPDDVKAVAPNVLAHRIVVSAEQWVEGIRPESNVERVLTSVAAPSTDELLTS